MARSSSSFAERFAGPPPKNKVKHLCTVKVTLDALPPDDRAALAAVLAADSGWTHAAIERELKAEGITISQSTVARHRNGECACE